MRYIISIHALREEGDRYLYRFIADFGVFLSTPSARRATSTSSLSRTGWSGFLSTPSARRATLSQGVKSGKSVYFYPRPPRGGRQVRHTSLTGNGHISIHALREEGDLLKMTFLSPLQISIHALREEGDLRNRQKQHFCAISIHALREEGDACFTMYFPSHGPFLSTPSARRATGHFFVDHHEIAISIHALREEGDLRMLLNSALISLFLSTPSARRATVVAVSRQLLTEHFYPRPPRGGRLAKNDIFISFTNFYPRPPRGGRLAV